MTPRLTIKGYLTIILSLVAAFLLTVMPLPIWAQWLRPAWVAMTVIYWVLAFPEKMNVTLAFFVGLYLDILTGTMIGEHALALVIVAYLVCKTYQRVRLFPILQQSLTIFLFILVYQLIIFVIQGIIGQIPHNFLYWLASVTSGLLWPWVYFLLRDLRQRWGLAKV